ncbi:MAG: hypothetical protein WCQ95_09745 [Bacteroidota bacterium]
MKINRTILKCKSRFYYYTLVFIGSASMLFFSRCANPTVKDNTAHLNDSIAKANHRQDSIAQADSLAEVKKQQWLTDSLAKADSIAQAKKHRNTYKPPSPITKYGVPIHKPVVTKYGIQPNTY